jgi:4,5:9,10-diseco-3-hydroxy-5,9,17-trioxoandrosta-1(10),2-diene-4-oate hydrolase
MPWLRTTLASLTLPLALSSCAGAVRLDPAIMHPDPPRRLALASRVPRGQVTVAGVALAVHDSAPGSDLPTIVCLHAIGHGGADFSRFEDLMAGEYRIITVDWPGHGASGQDTMPASAVRYAQLLQELVEQLGLERFAILGNSIGGAAAVRYAAEHPARVRGLILSNPGGFDPGGFFAGIYIRMKERHFQAGALGDPAFASWFRDYYAAILITDEAAAERQAIVRSAYEVAPRLLEAWRSFRSAEADQRGLAARLTMPVLVAWASEDDVVRWSRNRAAIETIPHARVVMFHAGHSPFLETPGPFAAEARSFLRGLR